MERQCLKDFQDYLDELNSDMNNLSALDLFEKKKIRDEIKLMYCNLENVYVNSFEFHDLNKRYMEVIHNVSRFMKKLEIVDPVCIMSMYGYLYKNGFLSYGHQFTYNKNIDEGLYLFGSNVVNGEGVCRHICSFLTDIYQDMGYVSCNVGTVFNKDIKNMQRQSLRSVRSDINRTGLKKRIEDLKFFILTKGVSYNHLVSLVVSDNGTLIVDPTNDIVFFVGDNNNIFPIIERNVLTKFEYVPIFNNDVENTISSFLKKTNMDTVNGVLKKFNDTWDLCEKYSGLFKYFYADNYLLYKDVIEKRRVLVREFQRNMD